MGNFLRMLILLNRRKGLCFFPTEIVLTPSRTFFFSTNTKKKCVLDSYD